MTDTLLDETTFEADLDEPTFETDPPQEREPEPFEETAQGPEAGGRRRRAPRRSVDRSVKGLVRQAIAKTLQVQALDQDALLLLADLLEVPATVPDVAARVVSSLHPGSDRSTHAMLRLAETKILQVQEATSATRQLTATLLNTRPDPAALAYAAATTTTSPATVLTDATTLVTGAPHERAITTMTMERSRLRQAWSVLAHIGVLPETMPTTEVLAAAAMATAEVDPQEVAATFEPVLRLLDRG